MKNAKLNWVRLPIETIENCRELGGYLTETGQPTKWHSFLRSSEMNKITNEDIDFLREYGVKTVIDLRRKDEIEKSKNPLSEMDDFDYHNISFHAGNVGDITKYAATKENFTMGDFYVDLLKQHHIVKDLFQTIYFAKEGAILFHCRVGKDRTGVLAMLLLGLAGVSKKDIVSNYEVSFTNLESLHEAVEKFDHISSDYFLSRRENIIKAYHYVIDHYGTFENYLKTVGINEEMLDGIKARLIENYKDAPYSVTK